ncbi:MAG: tetratricopeptide repeat protein, partial [Planctomycetaceae bacterium]|nr:tetratricopeptide repeat protein [Planctomycetaceae bacterium]
MRSPIQSGGVGSVVAQSWAHSLWAFIALFALAIPSQAADYDAAFKLFQTGEYEGALAATDLTTKEYLTDVRWWRLRLECLSTLGRYRDGADQLKIALRRHYVDGPIRVLGYEILRMNGEPQEARAVLAELLRIASYSPWQFRSADDRVWVGRAATLMGADARQVLEQFYDQALKLNPDLRDVYLATGELALLKHDQAVAADNFRAALKKFPDDPDLLCGLAQALDNDSPREATAALRQALAINPRHLASLFVTAEEAIAHEDYRGARSALDKILAINGNHPRAWALRAVLAHLHGDLTDEQLCRQAALCAWDTNPAVDQIIGEKLSSAYRFAEGAAYQRRSLEFDPQYLPARTQLAQDLLRLGESDEGWKLVSEVQ